MLMAERLQAKPSAAAMMIFIYAFFQVCVNCGVLYGLNTMSIFTTIWNIDIWNWLTLWYLELNFALNFHGHIEWEVIDYCPVDGANNVSWYWMVYFGLVLAPPCSSSCSFLCVMAPCVVFVWHVLTICVNKRPKPQLPPVVCYTYVPLVCNWSHKLACQMEIDVAYKAITIIELRLMLFYVDHN